MTKMNQKLRVRVQTVTHTTYEVKTSQGIDSLLNRPLTFWKKQKSVKVQYGVLPSASEHGDKYVLDFKVTEEIDLSQYKAYCSHFLLDNEIVIDGNAYVIKHGDPEDEYQRVCEHFHQFNLKHPRLTMQDMHETIHSCVEYPVKIKGDILMIAGKSFVYDSEEDLLHDNSILNEMMVEKQLHHRHAFKKWQKGKEVVSKHEAVVRDIDLEYDDDIPEDCFAVIIYPTGNYIFATGNIEYPYFECPIENTYLETSMKGVTLKTIEEELYKINKPDYNG